MSNTKNPFGPPPGGFVVKPVEPTAPVAPSAQPVTETGGFGSPAVEPAPKHEEKPA